MKFALLNSLILSIFVYNVVASQVVEIADSPVSVAVVGNSGKFKVTSKSNDTKAHIFVEMYAIQEIDTEGNSVGDAQGNKVSHGISNFANSGFALNSETTSVDLGEAKAEAFSLVLDPVLGEAVLKVQIYIVKTGGKYTIGSEEYELENGQVKFNIELENWPFCDSTVTDESSLKQCNEGENGAFIDLSLQITGSKAGNKKETAEGADVYDFGEGSSVVMSKVVKVDGTVVDIADGFPKVATVGGKQIFGIRLPKFTTSVVYDPVVNLAQDDRISDAASLTASWTVSFVVLALLAMFG